MQYRIVQIILIVTALAALLVSPPAATTKTAKFSGQQRMPSGLEPPAQDLAQIDEASEEARGERPYHLPVLLNHSVENHIEYFTTRGREAFQKGLDRSRRYVSPMQKILAEKNLPPDLVYVALIESGFNPYAVSWAKAVGPWQFMPATAKQYGLTIDWWVDERKDPVKSTYAAAEYLSDLYSLFGSWPLALASYNAGPRRVQRAVLRTRGENIWDLGTSRQIRRETKNYAPKYMAATIIAKDPEGYGFSVSDVKPLEYDQVVIAGSADLRHIARHAECTYEEIKELNPELKRWITPPHVTRYVLRIPRGKKRTFLANYTAVPASERVQWERHRVRRGDSLASLAKKYRSTIDVIRTVNRVKGDRVPRGRHLLVPVNSSKGHDLSYLEDESSAKRDRILHRVRRGETLRKIARAHNVSVRDIRGWNRGRLGKYLRIGQRLRLFVYLDQI